MKAMKKKTDGVGSGERTVGQVARAACREVADRISRAKASMLAEWSGALRTQQHALRLALNEAEALAWQTMYPHLVFPVLATEKVQAVAAWNTRQRQLWWNTPTVNR
jgi:hypothetical protein